jgi:hypothetical protein
MELVFADETNAWALGSDRRWRRVLNEHGVSSQEQFKKLAIDRARRRREREPELRAGDMSSPTE